MTPQTTTHLGRLIDLGPDGLGFIIPADQPNLKLAFFSQHGFRQSGFRDGRRVRFQFNQKRQVENVTLVR